jgi:hypothetical protein
MVTPPITIFGSGCAAGAGACLRTAPNAGGTLTITGSKIENNNGGEFGGGGIQNGGPKNVPGAVVVQSSTIAADGPCRLCHHHRSAPRLISC